jgi:hypothetical protein
MLEGKAEVDPDLKAAILDLCELCRETLIGAAETRLIVLCVHQALVNARVPGYLAAHESIGEKAERLEQLKRRLQSSISAVLDKMGDAR